MTSDIVKAIAKSKVYLPKPYLLDENVNANMDDIKPFLKFVLQSKIEYSEK